MLGPAVGEELAGRSWVLVAFAGGMAELSHITARTILVNDLHRHAINLARVIADVDTRRALLKRLNSKLFHPDTLAESQAYCEENEPQSKRDLHAAEHYFVSSWMGRSNKAGTDSEFDGRLALRWNAGGGDSVVRYHSAIRSMVAFSRVARRCQFETLDAFDLLARCEDTEEHAIYCDPPFPKKGRKYLHNAGNTDLDERVWHTRLRDQVERFEKTRVVMRFYDHPLIREIYEEPRWTWRRLKGRNQANEETAEVLLINGASVVSGDDINSRI